MSGKISYAWPVTSENAVVYNYFLQKIQRIKDNLANKKIVIFGAGIRGCCLLKILEENGFQKFVFVDNNTEKQGNLICHYDIVSFETALSDKEERVFLVSPEGGTAICEQLKGAGLKEDRDWFSFCVSAYDYYIQEYIRPIKEHLLVMGDCAFTHISLDDKNSDSLGAMIRNKINPGKCKVLDMHGMGQQAYYHVARSLLEQGETPNGFLLLLMIETMAPKVPIMPRTQHPELMKALVKAASSPNEDFISYANLTQERFDRFQLEAFASCGDTNNPVKEKLHMEINYLFRFRETAEGVVYLKKTIKMMNERGIPVILYIPPVNYFQGERLFGANFKKDYERNFIKLYQVLDKENLVYETVDASYLLDLNDFAAPNTIDETCNYNGRLKLLHYLGEAEALKPYFGSQKTEKETKADD